MKIAFPIALSLLFVASLAFNIFQYQHNSLGASQSAVGPTAQAAILCDVAKEHLKEHWTDQQKNIERVIQVVNHPEEMNAKLKSDLDDISTALSLTPSERTAFEPRYREIFDHHVATFREQLNQKSGSDWPAMFSTLKAFYAAEDSLVRERFGADRLVKFRDSQARKRTPMLAIIAQYANIDWDKSLVW